MKRKIIVLRHLISALILGEVILTDLFMGNEILSPTWNAVFLALMLCIIILDILRLIKRNTCTTETYLSMIVMCYVLWMYLLRPSMES